MKEEQLIIFEQRTIPAFDMNVNKHFIVIYILHTTTYTMLYRAMNIIFNLFVMDCGKMRFYFRFMTFTFFTTLSPQNLRANS